MLLQLGRLTASLNIFEYPEIADTMHVCFLENRRDLYFSGVWKSWKYGF